tara:strand:- start:627 stop:860 length:234 start_codon:yes stop_codon:yes gene_type:complete
MDYYLIFKKQPDGQLLIGTDNGFGVFWADQGFEALTNLISKSPSYLEDIEIKNSQNKTESIPDFLEKVSKLKLRVAN